MDYMNCMEKAKGSDILYVYIFFFICTKLVEDIVDKKFH